MKLHRIVNRDNGPVGWMHWCPGCEGPHAIYVEQPNPSTGARWSFNGNAEVPDFNPSILVFTEMNGARRTECHYFLHGGELQFCSDSPHKLSGQSVPLPEFPPRYLEPPTMTTRTKKAKPATDPNVMSRSAKASVTFVPPFNSATPKRSIAASVVQMNRDGTAHVVADDGHGTPYENVPVIEPGAVHPANGPFVVRERFVAPPPPAPAGAGATPQGTGPAVGAVIADAQAKAQAPSSLAANSRSRTPAQLKRKLPPAKRKAKKS